MLEAAPPSAPPADPELIDDALARAYRGIEAEPGAVEQAMRFVGGAIQTALERFVAALANDDVSAGVTVLAWTVVAGLAALALLALRRVRLSPRRRARSPRAHEEEIDWHARAEAASRAGDHREAVRALYRALVLALSRRGLVEDVPSLTAGRLRYDARGGRPDVASAIEQATLIYERVTYGLAEIERAHVDRMREAERTVLSS